MDCSSLISTLLDSASPTPSPQAIADNSLLHKNFPSSFGPEDGRRVFPTTYHTVTTMPDVLTATASPSARPKPLIGDGSGRYKILIVGNSGTLLLQTHTREWRTEVNDLSSLPFLLSLWSIVQAPER